MKTYANQKVIIINKKRVNKANTYMTIKKECLLNAISDLSHNELKVYLYLASNQDGFKMALSSSDISEKLNVHVRNVQIAINALIEKKYIKQQQGNQYIFCDEPMQEEENNASKILVAEDNASKSLVGECINHSQDVNKTLVGDAQNTRSNASETLVEIIHDNTLYNTSSIIQAEEKTEKTEKTEEENPKKEDTFINFLKGLNCTQLQQLKDMYSNGVQYKEIAYTYNIKYFDAAKFAEHYDEIYKERYSMENPEAVERRQQQEQAWREHEEDAAISDALSHWWKNKNKPAQDNNKPKPSTANKMTMIDGAAIDSRLAGIPYPESILENINNGIITVDELVEMQFDSENAASSAISWE